MIQVAVHGAEGRMGRMVTDLVRSAEDMQLCGLVTEPGSAAAGSERDGAPMVGQDHMASALPPGAVIVDFSLAAATPGLLRAAAELGSPLVIGTTGHSPEQLEAVRAFAADRPVVLAANFSIGIPALQMLLQLLARTLPRGFDAAELETHHATKLDRPSGTALKLAAAYAEARGCPQPAIGSQRLGGVVGEHTWTFSDQEETLVLTHRAHSRGAFLRGVLPAVRFATARESGFYELQNVLMGAGAE